MDTKRVDRVMQFALAEVGKADDPWHRELGPIHLIKYVYLADLAYAERNGETFTGAPWRFYHYGPYCNEVWLRIEPAMETIGAQKRTFDSQFRDDVTRWQSDDAEGDAERFGRDLPIEIKTAIRRQVRNWASDTQGLLHHVYDTAPMRNAAPNEPLRFEKLPPAPKPEEEEAVRARVEKENKRKLAELRARLAQRRPRPARTQPMREPRYDEVYFEGIAALDELTGGSVPNLKGELVIDDSVWKSETRSKHEPE